jgi:hypothetical protein
MKTNMAEKELLCYNSPSFLGNRMILQKEKAFREKEE